MNDRAQLAYNVFRGGFPKEKRTPRWTDLEPWMRDAMLVTYLQGKLDGSTLPAPSQARQGSE